MRLFAAVGIALVLSMAAAFDAGSKDAQVPPDPRTWIKLTFGLDEQAAAWDGQVVAVEGRVLQSAAWSFEQRDRFDAAAHKWFCTTIVLPGRSASSFAEPQRGVLLEVERTGKTGLEVSTAQGNFTIDLASLQAGRPALCLGGRASVELLGPSVELSDRVLDATAATENDFPALAVDAHGHRWLAWIGYEQESQRDHLYVLDLDDPHGLPVEIATAREQADPKLLLDHDGRLRLFFAAPEDGNWELWTALRTSEGWSGAVRLTTAPGTDFHLAAARGPDGSIWLAWQSFRAGNSDIFVKRLQAGRWSDDIPVADSSANEWEPSISVAPDGTAWVAYDSYESGNYDVFLTSVHFDARQRPQRGAAIGIATSADFEAHAYVEASDGRTIWVAYDAAGPNWGKDFTRDETLFQGNYAEPLHASRRVGLRAVVGGKVLQPTAEPPQRLTKLHPERIVHSDTDEMKRFYELPQLARDGSGRLWLLFRLNRQGYAGHPVQGANWEFFATTFADGQWLEPILLPISAGRQNQRVATAIAPDGRLALAWSTGHHHVDRPQKLRIGTVPPVSGKPATPTLQPAPFERAETKPEPIVRSWKLHRRGQAYEVFFGDLHRHTDISLCTPMIDGCLVDAYRYALDAARLDFLAVTDHTRDTDPYPWWRTQKANDLFHVPGVFAPIYAYERSNGTAGGGHRNVFFLERDWPVYRSDAFYANTGQKPPAGGTSPDVALYPHLRGKEALTAAHTPVYDAKSKRGTWTYHDPQVEPIAEIIQTYRRDYVQPGEPEWRSARIKGNLPEEASLWYALARGYRLGFIASSDHHATHTSYACVWATGLSRQEIFEALRARRTYAATEKILLEFRLGEAVMGEEIDAPETPELAVRVQGTSDIEELQIVRNREVIARLQPGRPDFETTFRDAEYPGGAAYYYVRVRQSDHHMAWSSPIWVK